MKELTERCKGIARDIFNDLGSGFLEYDRDFPEKPKTGRQLMENRYSSKPLRGRE